MCISDKLPGDALVISIRGKQGQAACVLGAETVLLGEHRRLRGAGRGAPDPSPVSLVLKVQDLGARL